MRPKDRKIPWNPVCSTISKAQEKNFFICRLPQASMAITGSTELHLAKVWG